MNKAGGIIGIIAGVLGIFAALTTLFIGGIGAAFQADGADTVVGFGWGGVLFSFLAIVFAAVVFSRPVGAGIGLVSTSILGIVFGGTFVALFMSLALIGGILALCGAKGHLQKRATFAAATGAPAPRQVSTKGTVILAIFATGVVVGVSIAGLRGMSAQQSKPQESIDELVSATPGGLSPHGELDQMFSLGSDNTDLQRQNKLKEITGQVVQWTLPVYEVSRSGNYYKIQTQSEAGFGRQAVSTVTYVFVRNDEERRVIEGLKTGDTVRFKGKIAGSTMRHLEIKPAILVLADVPVLAPAAQVTPAAESQPAPVPVAVEAPPQAQALANNEQTAAPDTVEADGICKGLDMAVTTDMSECLDRKFKDADKKLNARYKEVMAKLDDSQKAVLKREQIAWIKAKDAKCPKAGAEMAGGTMEGVLIADCFVQMTEKRFDYLAKYL